MDLTEARTMFNRPFGKKVNQPRLQPFELDALLEKARRQRSAPLSDVERLVDEVCILRGELDRALSELKRHP